MPKTCGRAPPALGIHLAVVLAGSTVRSFIQAGTPVLSVSVACGKWVFLAIPEDKANDPLMVKWRKNGTMPISGQAFSGPVFNDPAYVPLSPVPLALYMQRCCEHPRAVWREGGVRDRCPFYSFAGP